MNEVGLELTDFHEFFDLGDGDASGGGHHGIKVARCLPINEITPAVAFPGFDESEVGAKSALEDVVASIELARFFLLGDERSVSSGRKEAGDSGTAGANAFGERALRIEFEIEFAGKHELLEK